MTAATSQSTARSAPILESPRGTIDWDRFDQITTDGTRPAVVRLAEPIVDDGLVDAVLRRLFAVTPLRWRCFVDSERASIDDLVARAVVDRRGSPVETVIRDLCAGRAVTYIVDGVHDLSEPVARQIGTFLEPILDRRGPPTGGVTLVLFGGCYPATPFGPHHDDEDAFLFHIGPGVKRVSLWPDAAHHRPIEEPPDLTAELRPGDVLYLPRQCGHVAEQREPGHSIGAAMCSLDGEAVVEMLSRRVAADTADREPRPADGLAPRSADEFVAALSSARRGRDDRIGEAAVAYWCRLASNAGLSERGIHAGAPIPDSVAIDGATIGPATTVRALAPFRVVAGTSDERGRQLLYLRGRGIAAPPIRNVGGFVDVVNTRGLAPTDALDFLGNGWDIDMAVRLLVALAATRGLVAT